MSTDKPKLSAVERITREILRLAWNGDGTYDFERPSVRTVCRAAKASHATTHTVLKDFRAKAKAGELRHLADQVLVAAPLIGQPLAGASNDAHEPASTIVSLAPDTRRTDLFERAIANQERLLANLAATVADIQERVVNSRSEPASDLQPSPVSVQPSGKASHTVPLSVPDATGAETDRKRLGRAVEVILRERGPLSGPEIFRALPDAVKRPFGERKIQELLRWSKANLGNLGQIKDGRWRLPDQPDPVIHRRPTEDSVMRRISFAELAIKELRKNGRPLGATEIWDAGSRQGPLGFVRNHSFNVLRLANHPDLVRLPDRSWALTEWKTIPPRRPGYHSRLRADYYGDLAKAVWQILQTNGGAMTSFEIRKELSANMANKVQNRKMMDVLFQAQRELPQLVYGEDRRWRIEGMPEREGRNVTSADELARAVMEILRESRYPMKSAHIRKLIPANLKAAYPSILRPLRILRSRYPELVEVEKRTWALREAHVTTTS